MEFLTRLWLFAITLIFFANALFYSPPTAGRELTDPSDFLKVCGTAIRNKSGKGKRVYLRGTNAGGWLVHEEWMCPTSAPDAKTIRDVLEARFGAETRDELLDVYRDAYWTERDFDNCAAMGMTAIRLPFIYWDIADEDANILPGGFDRLDWFVENCARRGMYVILDLHGAYGSQSGKHHSGQINDGKQLYFSEENRAKTVKLWEGIARHYKGNPAIAAYDFLNEPERDVGYTDEVQWEFYDELYRAVRAIDPDHIITFEACWWPDSLPNPKQYGWENVMYQYHHYAWSASNNAQGIKEHSMGESLLILKKRHKTPVFIGEFTNFNQPDAWQFTLDQYNKLGFHWTTWTYKVTSTSSWGLYNHNPPRVDVYNDSEAEIREKWALTGYEHAAENPLKDVIAEYLPGRK